MYFKIMLSEGIQTKKGTDSLLYLFKILGLNSKEEVNQKENSLNLSEGQHK